MTVSLEGRVALRELMAQALQRWKGRRGNAEASLEGLLLAERDRRVSRGPAAGRESLPLGLHGAEVLDDAVGELGAGTGSAPTRARRDRAGGKISAPRFGQMLFALTVGGLEPAQGGGLGAALS